MFITAIHQSQKLAIPLFFAMSALFDESHRVTRPPLVGRMVVILYIFP